MYCLCCQCFFKVVDTMSVSLFLISLGRSIRTYIITIAVYIRFNVFIMLNISWGVSQIVTAAPTDTAHGEGMQIDEKSLFFVFLDALEYFVWCDNCARSGGRHIPEALCPDSQGSWGIGHQTLKRGCPIDHANPDRDCIKVDAGL